MITYGWETIDNLVSSGILDLAVRHWNEIALDKDQVPLDIDLEAYRRQEIDGTLRAFGARKDGVLIGYVLWYLWYPERYCTTLYVHDHIFFMVPEERTGWNGYKMLKAAIEVLPRPCKLQMREKLSFKQGRVGTILFKRLGLKPIEIVHSAFLE